ncbi:TetR/AcrR family transcriptional regulator [Rhodococcoides yunnanense]|uniref:TetR/AcrR family transcriptional regulator n=1 Tax=Rhodococcoides yunnanense TaxID=278209 RepID=UPI000933EBFC|nr:TetR/AcrR family transcriptional regulator [Rhodococcus yunnanensis]
MNPDDAYREDDLVVRLPRQQRSRDAWLRILEAGVAIVEEGGYEAFTIAAVCERADVAPRALYERVNTKDGLFLAVYEHKMVAIVADQNRVFAEGRWEGLPPAELVEGAVDGLARVFRTHAAFLRSVVLISGVHAEVNRRGSVHARSVGDEFTAVVMRAGQAIDHADPAAAARMSFTTAFSALVLRTSYGPSFSGPPVDDEAFVRELSEMICRYLLRAGDGSRSGA